MRVRPRRRCHRLHIATCRTRIGLSADAEAAICAGAAGAIASSAAAAAVTSGAAGARGCISAV